VRTQLQYQRTSPELDRPTFIYNLKNPVMLILVLVLKDALRTVFEVLVLVLESQVLVLVLILEV